MRILAGILSLAISLIATVANAITDCPYCSEGNVVCTGNLVPFSCCTGVGQGTCPTPTCHNQWIGHAKQMIDAVMTKSTAYQQQWMANQRFRCDVLWLDPVQHPSTLAYYASLACSDLRNLYIRPYVYEARAQRCCSETEGGPSCPSTALFEADPLFWENLPLMSDAVPTKTFTQELVDRTDGIHYCMTAGPELAGINPAGQEIDHHEYNYFIDSQGHIDFLTPFIAISYWYHHKGCDGYLTNDNTPTLEDKDGDWVPNNWDPQPYAMDSAYQWTSGAPYCLFTALNGVKCSYDLYGAGGFEYETDAHGGAPGIGDWGECGDCNFDGKIDVTDLVCINSTIFAGPQFGDIARLDVNSSGTVTVSDYIKVNEYIFNPTKRLVCNQNKLCRATWNGPGTSETCGF